MYTRACSELSGADGSGGRLCPPLQAPALGESRAGHRGFAAHPSQYSTAAVWSFFCCAWTDVISPLADSFGFAASEICHEKVGVGRSQAGGVVRRAGGRVPAWSQDSVYCVCFAKEGRLTGTSRGNAHSKTLTFPSLLLQTLVWTMLLQDAFPFGS